jgi:hypothetical protein
MVKLVDLKGNVYGEFPSLAEAEAALALRVDSEDDDPLTTFVGAGPSYRIVDASREWRFNTTSNRYEWMALPVE